MILVQNQKIGEIPLLHLIQEGKNQEPLPFIIFVHGFSSAKEHNLHYAYLLAKKGYRVVLPEAIYHGERGPEIREDELDFHFWEIVLKTIHELELIKDYYESKNLIDAHNIGLAGTSMGGFVTLGAMTKYPWIKAAVSLMGMPYFEKFAHFQIEHIQKSGMQLPISQAELEELYVQIGKLDLSGQPEKLNGRPLLLWHGKHDKVVPYSFTYDFYQKIKPMYQREPEKLQFISDENADHKVSREGVLRLVDWFEKYVPPTNVAYVPTHGKF